MQTSDNNETKQLIGSFQSYSGEPSSNIFNKMIYPFISHQSKTIVEQYTDGVHLFDFHIKWNNKFKKFQPICGKWTTGKSLLQMMSSLNKIVQQNNDKIYYILTLENEVDVEHNDIENTNDYLELLKNFNSISNSLNSFFSSLDIIEKRITVKQSFWNRLIHGPKYKTIWKDKDNKDIKYEFDKVHRFIPYLSNKISKLLNRNKKEQNNSNDVYIIKEFI